MKLPVEFEKRMRMLLGDEFDAFAASLECSPERALRVNRLKADEHFPIEGLSGLGKPIPYAADGYYFEADRIGIHPYHHAGAIYVQEPAAMAPVSALPVQRGWKVLDLCASPGGKSGQLAALIGEEGTLLSNEYVAPRCATLAGNIERLGVQNAIVTNADSAQLAEWYPEAFDLVVVDAPCSGEGMFRKNEQAVAQWTPSLVDECAERQRELLSAAARMVKAGGWLLYSTCTFEVAENEGAVAWLLAERADFSLTAPNEQVAAIARPGKAITDSEYTLTEAQAALCCRFYPHVSGGEGQFLAVMRREGVLESEHASPTLADLLSTAAVQNKGKKGRAERSASAPKQETLRPLTADERTLCEGLLGEWLTDEGLAKLLPRLALRGDTLWAIGAKLRLPPARVYLPGVCVGTLSAVSSNDKRRTSGKSDIKTSEKGKNIRFQPHHQFFSAYGRYFVNRIELDPTDEGENRLLTAYLHGETIPASFDGWGVVTVSGAPIGGVKASSGVAKNHYPKGLRNF